MKQSTTYIGAITCYENKNLNRNAHGPICGKGRIRVRRAHR